ncbi:MAG: hypothetical protein IJZ84_03100 [Lachnospiraceae bacterium]|nr:hypothetical protein [Lachnospiraceae bacterium]
MIYLSHFQFPHIEREYSFIMGLKRTCYDTVYPFQILSKNGLEMLVIATHSPFLLSMRDAKIYDMDENPIDVKRWTELKNVRAYYEFFKNHEREF